MKPHTLGSDNGRLVCWHCGEPVPERGRWPITIESVEQETCCAGCQAVAAAISGSGLTQYYRVREGPAVQAGKGADPDPALYDESDVEAHFVRRVGEHCEATLLVDGMRCGACVWLLEQTLKNQPGLTDIRINLSAERAQLQWDPNRTRLSDLIRAARRIGYGLLPHDNEAREALVAAQSRARLRRLFVAGIAMMQVMMYAVPVYLADAGEIEPQFESLMRWASLVLTLPAVFYSATPFFFGAWRDLRTLSPGMDTPVAIGLIAAFAASVVATLTGQGEVWFDTVTMFVFLLLAARHLEWLARRRASRAIDRLTAARPQAVQRLSEFDDQIETIPASRLTPGDRFIVGEGETLAVDAVVLNEHASFDQSLLTGESLPVTRRMGETVPGGSINLGDPLRMRAVSGWADSTLSTLGQLAEQAGSARPQITAVTDRVARWFVSGLLIFAMLVGLAWMQIEPDRALPIAIAVLVVSCPCALSLATPAALAAASGHALARGLVLVRSDALESLADATAVVFDKTGTLTRGEPDLIEIQMLLGDANAGPGSLNADGWLAIAAALELGSAHPIGRALRAAATSRGIEIPLAERLHSHPGQGIEGIVQGQTWRIGRLDFVRNAQFSLGPEHAVDPDSMTIQPGVIEICLGRPGHPEARLVFSDPIRSESPSIVQALRAQGLEIHLVSGDRPETVAHVAAALGIEHHRGHATPSDKLAWVQSLQARGHRVLMVGDGINDAPVLAGADVSVAVGNASALARISADVVLIGERLEQLIELRRLALQTRRIIRQNLTWAMAYNLLAIPLAAFGGVSAWLAALGMSASSLLVAANALRLLPSERFDRSTASKASAEPTPAPSAQAGRPERVEHA